eukprot:m.682095 g.682095  ORF g.682095 m.682095 type:complete len:336 (+) comp22816_c0_seq7:2180-3187(+)
MALPAPVRGQQSNPRPVPQLRACTPSRLSAHEWVLRGRPENKQQRACRCRNQCLCRLHTAPPSRRTASARHPPEVSLCEVLSQGGCRHATRCSCRCLCPACLVASLCTHGQSQTGPAADHHALVGSTGVDAKGAAKKSAPRRKSGSKRQLNLSSGRNSAPPTRHVGAGGGRVRRASSGNRTKRPASAVRATSPSVGGGSDMHYRSQSLPDLGVVWEGVAGYDGLGVGAALSIDEVALLQQLDTDGTLDVSAAVPDDVMDGGDVFPAYEDAGWYGMIDNSTHAACTPAETAPLALLREEDSVGGLLPADAYGEFPLALGDAACDYPDLFPPLLEGV